MDVRIVQENGKRKLFGAGCPLFLLIAALANLERARDATARLGRARRAAGSRSIDRRATARQIDDEA